MNGLRRAWFPLRLARARLGSSRERLLLVAVGIVAGAAALAAVLSGRLVMQDRSLAQATAQLSPSERSLEVAWFGALGGKLARARPRGDRRARDPVGARDAVPRVAGRRPPDQPARGERPVAIRASALGAPAEHVRAIALRSAATRRQGRRAVGARASPDPGRHGHPRPECAVRAVDPTYPELARRAGGSLPHASAVARAARRRRRRALAHAGAETRSSVRTPGSSRAAGRRASMVGRHLRAVRQRRPSRPRCAVICVRGHRPDRCADGGRLVIARRGAAAAAARR